MNFKNKLRYLENENGATSVLVIFMMIVLVTLGAFAITSANVNLIFSRKATNLNAIYYSLDSLGEEYIADIDKALAEAEIMALENINKNVGVSKNNTEISENINKLYMQYANEKLSELREKYAESSVIAFIDNEVVLEIETEFNLNAKDYPNYNLKIETIVNPIAYNIDTTNNKLVGKRDINVPRYEIKNWTQWQTPVEVTTDDIELWDGKVKE